MIAVTFRTWMMTLVCLLGTYAAGASDSLYVHLGGEPGVAAIANSLIDRVATDPLTGPSFKDSKLSRIKTLLAEQICDLSGGPCHYSGDSMKEVHAGHHMSPCRRDDTACAYGTLGSRFRLCRSRSTSAAGR